MVVLVCGAFIEMDILVNCLISNHTIPYPLVATTLENAKYTLNNGSTVHRNPKQSATLATKCFQLNQNQMLCVALIVV